MNTNYTDTQLKQALAKMLPEKVFFHGSQNDFGLFWNQPTLCNEVLDTELLLLCCLVEIELPTKEWLEFRGMLESANSGRDISATWQQLTIGLCKVKGIEICK